MAQVGEDGVGVFVLCREHRAVFGGQGDHVGAGQQVGALPAGGGGIGIESVVEGGIRIACIRNDRIRLPGHRVGNEQLGAVLDVEGLVTGASKINGRRGALDGIAVDHQQGVVTEIGGIIYGFASDLCLVFARRSCHRGHTGINDDLTICAQLNAFSHGQHGLASAQRELTAVDSCCGEARLLRQLLQIVQTGGHVEDVTVACESFGANGAIEVQRNV